jgi:hypothetical protein
MEYGAGHRPLVLPMQQRIECWLRGKAFASNNLHFTAKAIELTHDLPIDRSPRQATNAVHPPAAQHGVFTERGVTCRSCERVPVDRSYEGRPFRAISCISLAPARLDRYLRGCAGHLAHPVCSIPFDQGPNSKTGVLPKKEGLCEQ